MIYLAIKEVETHASGKMIRTIKLMFKKYLVFKVIAIVSILPAVASCSSLWRELTKSNVTQYQLEIALLQPNDLLGWTAGSSETLIGGSSAWGDVSSENTLSDEEKDMICDLTGGKTSRVMTSPYGNVVAYSTAEATCGTWDEMLKNTLSNEDFYRQAAREQMASAVAIYSAGLSNFKYERIDLGIGEKALVYKYSGDIIGPDGQLVFVGYQVSQFTDLMTTSLFMEGELGAVSESEAVRLASIINSRAVAAESKGG